MKSDKGRNSRQENNNSNIQIIVAIIALIGAVLAAIISNWDKVFPPPQQYPTSTPMIARIKPTHIEAESYTTSSAHVLRQDDGGISFLGYINDGEWTKYENINMDSGEIHSLSARIASAENGGTIEVRLDNPNGKIVGICQVPNTGGWQTWQTISCDITNTVSETNTIYLVYKGSGTYLFNIDWLDFN